MNSVVSRLCAGALVLCVLPLAANAGTLTFGPSAYLQHGDTPAGFCDGCDIKIEDFEDNLLDPFLTISNGSILPPNSVSGSSTPVTDSVDGDDGSVDGSGIGGYSWYTGIGNSNDNTLTIDFASNVDCAGLVFTDGDPISSLISLEALDSDGNVMATIAADLADGVFTGETAEDSFLGFSDMDGGIAALRLIMTGGEGIEIDHVHWADCPVVPEPATSGMMVMTLLGLVGWRRRNR